MLLSRKVIQDQHEKRHYFMIRAFSRPMKQQTKNKGSQFFCYNCLHSCSSHVSLDKHMELCYKHNTQAMQLRENDQDKEVSFKGLQKQLHVPFVIYAALESYTESIDHCPPHRTQSSTTEYQRHATSDSATWGLYCWQMHEKTISQSHPERF